MNELKGAKKIVVFDTNAYRVATSGLSLDEAKKKAGEIRSAENELEYCALAHPIVIWELLIHLANSNDPAYGHCLNAMVALGTRTASRSVSDGSIWLMADPLSSVCQAVFDRVPKGYEEGLENLGTLVTHITMNAPDLSDATLQKNIADLAQAMAKREKTWLEGMKDVMESSSPGAAKLIFGGSADKEALAKLRKYLGSSAFFEDWSIYTVAVHAPAVNIPRLPPHELHLKGKLVRKWFPVPFHLTRVLLQKLATVTPPDLSSPKRKRWNFIWDAMICFSLGPGLMETASVYLVTGDTDIADAAVEAGYGTLVLPLSDYLKEIGV